MHYGRCASGAWPRKEALLDGGGGGGGGAVGGWGVTHVPRLNFTTCLVLFVAISYFFCPRSLFQGHFYNN